MGRAFRIASCGPRNVKSSAALRNSRLQTHFATTFAVTGTMIFGCSLLSVTISTVRVKPPIAFGFAARTIV